LQVSFSEKGSGTIVLTPEELVAMVLGHAVEISVAYALESTGKPLSPPPNDMVLTIPMFATQMERQAYLDAAAIAHLNVLQLVDENTASALHFAMDKSFAPVEEGGLGEQILLFYNMGAASTQVSLIKFSSSATASGLPKGKSPVPTLQVLAKAWDETCGGDAFDHVIVEYFADHFNTAYRKSTNNQKFDIRTQPKSMTKLKLQANKVKHVLSANTEIPVYIDSVHDDIPLKVDFTRVLFEQLAQDLLQRSIQPVLQVLARAAQQYNLTLANNVTGVELIGGGMRIPAVQDALHEHAFNKTMEIGLHINSDESMALGAAFVGANISTAFRVRPVGITDIYPYPIMISLSNLPPSEDPKNKKAKSKSPSDSEMEEWSKQATIFKAFSKTGVKKTIAFSHDRDVHCALDYVTSTSAEGDDSLSAPSLPIGSESSIERYNITGVEAFATEMTEKGLGKPKVSLQFELSASGITSLVKAEAAVEELYTVEEEIEVDDEDAANATNSTAGDGNVTTTPSVNITTEDNATTTNSTSVNAGNGTSVPTIPKKKIKVEKVRGHSCCEILIEL
jgi:hypoxia up-regulated 1